MPKASTPRTTRNSAMKAKLAAPARTTKTIEKLTAVRNSMKAKAKKPAVKPVAAPKVAKKAPVPPKRNAKTKISSKADTLDLCLILDCTGSMYSWI